MGEKNDIAGRSSDRKEDLSYTLTFRDVVDILEVIDSSDGKELTLEVGDLKLSVMKR